MTDFLKAVPPWFLVMVVVMAIAIVGWLFNRNIAKLDDTLNRFQKLIDSLFQKHEQTIRETARLDSRLATLEGSHDALVGFHKRRTDDLK